MNVCGTCGSPTARHHVAGTGGPVVMVCIANPRHRVEIPESGWSIKDARRIVASIPPLTDAQCDAAALDYAQARLAEMQAQLEALADYIDANPLEGDHGTSDRIREIARG